MLNNLLLCNEKVNTNPLVLVNTLFVVVDYRTSILGYWRDKQGKLYIDNIDAVKYSVSETLRFNIHIKQLFASGEKGIFYKDIYNYGVLQFPNGTREVLKNRIEILYNYKPSEKEIRLLLKKYNGLTVYEIDNGTYLIEIYS